MLDALGLRDRLPPGRHGLVEMAKMLLGEAEMRQPGRAWVLTEFVSESVVLGPIHGKGALQMLAPLHSVTPPYQ